MDLSSDSRKKIAIKMAFIKREGGGIRIIKAEKEKGHL